MSTRVSTIIKINVWCLLWFHCYHHFEDCFFLLQYKLHFTALAFEISDLSLGSTERVIKRLWWAQDCSKKKLCPSLWFWHVWELSDLFLFKALWVEYLHRLYRLYLHRLWLKWRHCSCPLALIFNTHSVPPGRWALRLAMGHSRLGERTSNRCTHEAFKVLMAESAVRSQDGLVERCLGMSLRSQVHQDGGHRK